MIVHRLGGCAPTPLAHYLKALGVLRLVVEQLDPDACGWWEGEQFLLASTQDEQRLLAFFLDDYRPTPLVSPWNKGSGFYSDEDAGLAPIERSQAARFEPLRAGIRAARGPLDAIRAADRLVRQIKAEAQLKSLTPAQRDALRRSEDYKRRLLEAEKRFKQLKSGDLIPALRLAWHGPHREWMDAALVVGDDGSVQFPALLGTGGNDGRLDFTNNFVQRLNELFDCAEPNGRARPDSERWVRQALFGGPSMTQVAGLPVGQFAPGAAGGPNMSFGADGSSALNPADFVLMLEGTVLFTSALTRRLQANASSRASAPFALSARAAGYASAAESDENLRGEQWMPLWSAPTGLAELKRLLAEGRAQLGPRQAVEPLDFARAIARLGTARGVSAFQRFGYIERNGQSNLAVPLGRFVVPDQSSRKLTCLDDIELWLWRLRRQTRATQAAHRLAQAERRLTDALLAIAQHPDQPAHWRCALFCLADIEAIQNAGSGYEAGPIPPLDPEWVRAAHDGDDVELRLALAFALQTEELSGAERDACAPVRRYWVSLEGGRFATTGTAPLIRLARRPDRVMQARRGVDDASALIARSLLEASRRGVRKWVLKPTRDAAVSAADLALVLTGAVDLDRTLRLARALMAIDLRKWAQRPVVLPPSVGPEMPDDAWLAIRLTLLPYCLWPGQRIAADPAILRRLESGDASAAIDLALARLRVYGMQPVIRMGTVPADAARLWAAALAFPITFQTARAFARRLDPTFAREDVA